METVDSSGNLSGDQQVAPQMAYWNVKPRLFVLLASSFVFGTALVVSHVDHVFMFILLVGLASLRIFNVRSKLLVLVAVFFTAGVVNAEFKAPHPAADDISRYSGTSCLIAGVVENAAPLNSADGTRIVLGCRSIGQGYAELNPKGALPSVAVSGRIQVILLSRERLENNSSLPLGHNRSMERQNSGRDARAPGEGQITKANLELQRRGILSSNPPASSAPTLLHDANRSLVTEGDYVILRARPFSLLGAKGAKQQRVANFLARKGIFCEARSAESSLMLLPQQAAAKKDLVEETASYWRKSLVAFHERAVGTVDGSLLASMVLGDRALNLNRDISDKFRCSGLSHVLAASGFNISVVAATIYFVLRFCIGNLWISNTMCLTGMICYVAIAGPSPSVMRAFLMGALMLFSRCVGRSIHMPAALALTMFVVLLVDPWSAADVGFQLSYFSTAGMILGATEFTELVNQRISRCPKWIRVTLAATMVAQACVLPLQLYYFKQLTPYCLIANVLVVPMVAPITILGFAASMVFMLETAMHCGNFISLGLDKICYYPVELIRNEVTCISSFPDAQISTGQAGLPAVLLYYAVLLLFPVLAFRSKLRLWSFLFLLSLVTLIVSILGSNTN